MSRKVIARFLSIECYRVTETFSTQLIFASGCNLVVWPGSLAVIARAVLHTNVARWRPLISAHLSVLSFCGCSDPPGGGRRGALGEDGAEAAAGSER